MSSLSSYIFRVANTTLHTSLTYKQSQKKLLHEEIYNKNYLVSQLDRDSKLLYKNVKSALNILDFHHVLNISLIANEKESERIKFRNLSKLKNLIPNFSWDMVATSSHDPEKVIFNFSCHELTSSEKHLLSKGLRFAIPPRQIDYSSYLAEQELLYRSTTGLSVTSEVGNIKLGDIAKAKVKDIRLSSYKLLNDNCKYENDLSSEKLSSLKTLMRNKNIVIKNLTKVNSIVIIDMQKVYSR